MRSFPIALLLMAVCSGGVSAQDETLSPTGLKQKTIFVAPGGDDANPGTMEMPLASLQKAQELVSAGDTVYIRIYRLTASNASGVRVLQKKMVLLK